MSLAATHNHSNASWRGLLESGAEYCRNFDPTLDDDWVRSVKREINSSRMDHLLSSAEKISSILGAPDGGEYRKWLSETVGQLRATDPSVLLTLQDLELPLTTTNHDGLLEEQTRLQPITWLNTPLLVDWLHDRERGILHWHGFWRDPESVVLGIRSYQRILDDQRAQEALRALLATKVLLFVGFGAGVQDPNFTPLREWMGQFFAGATTCHYRLALQQDVEPVQAEHARDERIKVIPFGERYDDLAPFLRRLCRVPSHSVSSQVGQAPERISRIPSKCRCCGRAELIDHLTDVLVVDNPKPVPLLGGPAMGKTTVAINVLHDPRVSCRFGKRRYFVNCNGAKSRGDLAAKIALAVGVAHSPYPEEAALEALPSRPALLVLDDAETPWNADRSEVEGLLGRLASVAELALLFVIRGAHTPLHIELHPPTEVPPLEEDDAREAFLQIAGRRHTDDPHLGTLLEEIGYVPFAVTLFACLAQAEPDLVGLLSGWRNKRMEFLQNSWVSEEYQRMAASFEVSISAPNMDEVARRLLAVLGMLPDGIAPEDLAAVFPDQGEVAAATLRKVALAFPTERRLRLHGMLREHVRERYAPEPDDLRHVIEWYMRLAVEADAGFDGRSGDQAVSRFATNLGNVQAAIRAGFDSVSERVALEGAASLAAFVFLTGAGSRELVRTAQGLQDSMPAGLRARLGRNCADLEMQLGNPDGARRMYEAASHSFEVEDDQNGTADCIKKIADLERRNGKLQEAEHGYRSALELCRQTGNLIGQAGCIAGLADIAMPQTIWFEASDSFEEAFRLCFQAGNYAGMAYCRMRLGYVSLEQKHFDEARKEFERAIPLACRAHHLLIKASATRAWNG